VWWSNTRIILKRFTISLTRLMVRGDPTMMSSSTTTSFGLDLSRGTDKYFDNGATMRFICCVFNVVYRTTCVYQESMSVRLICVPRFSSVVVTYLQEDHQGVLGLRFEAPRSHTTSCTFLSDPSGRDDFPRCTYLASYLQYLSPILRNLCQPGFSLYHAFYFPYTSEDNIQLISYFVVQSML